MLEIAVAVAGLGWKHNCLAVVLVGAHEGYLLRRETAAAGEGLDAVHTAATIAEVGLAEVQTVVLGKDDEETGFGRIDRGLARPVQTSGRLRWGLRSWRVVEGERNL